jgi:hypothetical protein
MNLLNESHFNLGDKVKIDGDGDIVATITAFSFDGAWRYQLSWFTNGDHRSDWFQGWRISMVEPDEVESYPKLGQK